MAKKAKARKRQSAKKRRKVEVTDKDLKTIKKAKKKGDKPDFNVRDTPDRDEFEN